MPGTKVGRSSTTDQVRELKDLIVGYVRQETVGHVGALWRYLRWGVIGSVLQGIGFAFLILGLLRGLQQVNALNGPTQRNGIHGSWLIYLITILAGLVIVVTSFWQIRRANQRRTRRQS